MLVKTYCAAVNGLDVTTVSCEISMTRGVPTLRKKVPATTSR